MSLLKAFNFNSSEKSPIQLLSSLHEFGQSFRAFNLGKIAQTEISIWLEESTTTNTLGQHKLVLRIVNEGEQSVANLELSVKSTNQVVIANKGEIFGTSKNKKVIRSLGAKNCESYSTFIALKNYFENHSISVSISKQNAQKSIENLTATVLISSSVNSISA